MKNLKNNKGFSLVELIIVVAIMAILIGVLAPQYLKYVEKSRVTSDRDIIDTARKALETVASDPDVALSEDKYEVTINKDDGTVLTEGDTDTSFKDAFNAIVDKGDTRKFKSKTYSQDVTITLTFDGGTPVIEVDDPNGSGTNSKTETEDPNKEGN